MCLPTVSEQGLTSPPTQYRLSGRQFYRSQDTTNSIKLLKKNATKTIDNPEEANNINYSITKLAWFIASYDPQPGNKVGLFYNKT